jgi:succinate-acetate transporter protein
VSSNRRRIPWGIALFLVYGFLILAGVGLSLPAVVAMATDMPVSFAGLVVMALLAYTIFTLTLVLQRKTAARTLTLGLASLTIPAILLGFAYGQAILAAAGVLFAALLFRGLTRPTVAGYLNEV